MKAGLAVGGVLVLLLAGLGVAWALGRLPISLARLVEPQQGEAADATLGFLDDLKFKDYQAAARRFSQQDRDDVDVERLVTASGQRP